MCEHDFRQCLPIRESVIRCIKCMEVRRLAQFTPMSVRQGYITMMIMVPGNPPKDAVITLDGQVGGWRVL